MSNSWQELIVLAIVTFAVAYLLRRGWGAVNRNAGGGCGSCPTCPATETVRGAPTPMVTVEQLTTSAKTGEAKSSAGI